MAEISSAARMSFSALPHLWWSCTSKKETQFNGMIIGSIPNLCRIPALGVMQMTTPNGTYNSLWKTLHVKKWNYRNSANLDQPISSSWSVVVHQSKGLPYGMESFLCANLRRKDHSLSMASPSVRPNPSSRLVLYMICEWQSITFNSQFTQLLHYGQVVNQFTL